MSRNPRSLSKALRREWSSKLAASGFVDIEDESGNLIRWDSSEFRSREPSPRDELNRRRPIEVFASIQDYYRVATHMLELHAFENEVERQIWAHHCDGRGFHWIAEVLSTPTRPVSWFKVQTVIQKIKDWIPYYDDVDSPGEEES